MTISISTHVLNLADGAPAQGLQVTLRSGDADIAAVVTDADGRIADWPGAPTLGTGEYQLQFDTAQWFAVRGDECFYPEVCITFSALEARHYHVPLLLNRYGYSTYRGS